MKGILALAVLLGALAFALPGNMLETGSDRCGCCHREADEDPERDRCCGEDCCSPEFVESAAEASDCPGGNPVSHCGGCR